MFIAAAGCVTVNINAPALTSPTLVPSSANGTDSSTPAFNNSLSANLSSLNSTTAETNRTTGTSLYATPRVTLNPNSKSDVNKRFQEVAFGNEAQYLNRWENRHVKLGIAGEYTMEDVQTLTDFVIRFNNESDTTRLTLPYESENEEFTIRIVPPSFFAAIDEDTADKVIKNTETGEVLFVDQTNNLSWVEKDTIYINSRYTGQARKYLILRGLLYDLGFEGFTDDTTSIFHYEARTTNLSRMDWAVIDLMYSKKFNYGDSISSVKSKLN